MVYVEGRPGAKISVFGGQDTPRIVFMTGDADSADLVLAGDCGLGVGTDAIELVAEVLLAGPSKTTKIETVKVGPVDLRPVANGWVQSSALRRIGLGTRPCLQVVPLLGTAVTIDVPDMQVDFAADREPAWAYLADSVVWTFSFPVGFTVVTDSRALQGKAITEVSRWDDGEFEMLAIGDDDVHPNEEDLRVVPLSTLAAVDRTLEPLFETPRGCSWWRANGSSPWQHWRGWRETVE